MKIKIVSKSGRTPIYGTSQSAGFDLPAYLPEGSIVLEKGKRMLVPTGIFIELPCGYEAQVRARSGLAIKNGIGTVDADYRGELKVPMINWGDEDFTINDGDRIAQVVIAKHERAEFELCEELGETERGSGGFGHTGV